MTIAALRALLEVEQPDVDLAEVTDTIDTHRRPQTADDSTDRPAVRIELAATDGDANLLAWADQHQAAAVGRHAQRAREALAALRERRSVEAELEQIQGEASEIEQRLTTLRQREAELKPQKQRRPSRDYKPREVRQWARGVGLDVPDRGAIPHTVLNAWRERHRPTPLRPVG